MEVSVTERITKKLSGPSRMDEALETRTKGGAYPHRKFFVFKYRVSGPLGLKILATGSSKSQTILGRTKKYLLTERRIRSVPFSPVPSRVLQRKDSGVLDN